MKIKTQLCLEDDRGAVTGEDRLLALFERTAESGSLAAAAEALNEPYDRLLTLFRALEDALDLTLIEPGDAKGKKPDARLVPEVARRIKEKGGGGKTGLLSMLLPPAVKKNQGLVQVVAVVGPAGSGKTALVGRLIQELSGRGWRVGVIDRWSEEEGQTPPPSPPGPAGASGWVLSGPQGLTARVPLEEELQPEIVAANYLPGADLALVESRERVNLPSIDLFRQDRQKLPLTRKRKYLLAVTGDKPPKDQDWPYFSEDNVAGLVDLIERNILPQRDKARPVELWVNGRRVPMVPFVEEIIASTVAGLISSLKSCEQAGDIHLTIRR